MQTTSYTNAFITKLKVTDRYVYIKFLWKPNDKHLFNAKVFDSESVWSGFFSNESMKQNYERIEEPEEIYCNTTLSALRGTSQEFVYTFPAVHNETDSSEFSWKRKFEDGTIQNHGSFTVERCKETHSLIDLLLAQNNEFECQIKQYQRNTEELNEKINRYENEMEKCSEIKTTIEANLYGKFVQLLNEKKKRIQLLENHLQKINDTDNMSVDNYLI